MPELFAGASAGVLRALAQGLRTERADRTLSRFTLNCVCPCPDDVADEIVHLSRENMSSAHLALLLDTRAEAVEARLSGSLPIELVWSGPANTASRSRATSVVVRDLFATAERSVLVSTFVVASARRVFEPLAVRMAERPGLRVRIFLHVARGRRDTRHESEILREYASEFFAEWPGERRPEVFYDPRSLATDPAIRAAWHAKCVVVDEQVAFVTSANFTEWAQSRNVEAGVFVRDQRFAEQLAGQFDALQHARRVARLPGC